MVRRKYFSLPYSFFVISSDEQNPARLVKSLAAAFLKRVDRRIVEWFATISFEQDDAERSDAVGHQHRYDRGPTQLPGEIFVGECDAPFGARCDRKRD